MFARRAFLMKTLVSIAVVCIVPAIVQGQQQTSRAQPGTKWTDEQLKQAVAPMRVGRKLMPKSWPDGARVAVCLSWDVDNEAIELAAGVTAPIQLSDSEYGMKEALPRILALYDRYRIPGSFYIPAANGVLYPELIVEFKKRPQHEVGIHGWIHENLVEINDPVEEGRLLHKAIDFWSQALGKKPVGYRAPFWTFSAHTLDLIRKAGFEYDSSAMGMDAPYEIASSGRATGLVELPISWILDDAAYFGLHHQTGQSPSPEVTFKVFQDEFDQAYAEGTLFILTLHPMISGRRSRMMYFEKLVEHIKSKPGVWFATGQQIAAYVKQQNVR